MTLMLSTNESEQLLASSLLSGVAEEIRLAIFRRLVESRLAAGSPLLSQGKANHHLWFVLEGSVALERQQADGHVDRLATLAAPAIFGTSTFFRSTAPSATVRASTPLLVWSLDRESYESLRQFDPRAAESLALATLNVLAERFDQLDVRIGELMAEHADDHPRANEWANFRKRLFEDPAV